MSRCEWIANQEAQAGFLADCMPGWSLYQGGMGSGKTWAGARKLLALHAVNRCPGAVLAPTYGDLWRVMVPEIMNAASEARLLARSHAGGAGQWKFPHIMVMSQPILLVSADEPDRIAGWEVGHLWVDEGARIQTSADNPRKDAPTQLRGRLRHRAARSKHALVTTTPEGMDTWVQRDWFDAPKRNHRRYIGQTAKNTALDPEYAENLRAAVGSELADQYLEGVAVSYVASRAHPTFMPATHVAECRPTPYATRHIGCDFNVAPMCWVLLEQANGGKLRVLDEMVIPNNGQVDAGIHNAHARKWSVGEDGQQVPVVFHPDRSSKRRSTVGDPEVVVLVNTARSLGWNVTCDAFGSNPPVDARINLLARLLMDARGETSMTIDPRCKRLIADLTKTSRTTNGYDPGPMGDRGHILDALGYACWDLCQPSQRAQVANWKL